MQHIKKSGNLFGLGKFKQILECHVETSAINLEMNLLIKLTL